MHNKPSKKHPFKPPSTWLPTTTPSTTLENYLEATKFELAHIRLRNQKSNMSKQELSAITTLKNNTDLVIKPYDKGRGICIMNRADYLKVGFKHLESEHYTPLDQDITQQTIRLVHNVLTEMRQLNLIDNHTLKYLDPLTQDCTCPTMYFLPKIHKTPPNGEPFVGRPIISGCSSPTAKISEYVDHFLLPVVTQQPTYVRDTADILRKLEETTLPQEVLITSIDVVSMYTNVRQAEAIDCVCNALDRTNYTYSVTKPPSEYIRKLMELILGRNCFQFGNKFFLQKIGCAMGSTASPEICDITLHDLEKTILTQAEHILTWWRYRDDILVIYNSTLENFKKLIDTMNQMHPTLKFTFEASETSINYLDLTIFKGQRFRTSGILDTKVYTKPTETYQYLHKTSSHPPHVFNAFIYGETLRYARNTNNLDDFTTKVNTFSEKLQARGYTPTEIRETTQKVEHQNRMHLIRKMDGNETKAIPTVFTTTYNPSINHGDLKKAVNKHWHLIQRNPILGKIFPKPPMIAFKKAQNIKEKLVRAKLSNPTDRTNEGPTPIPVDSGFDEPDETLNILFSLLEEQLSPI